MAERENKTVEKVREVYSLTPAAITHGLHSKIDGRQFVIDYAKDFNGKRISEDATVCHMIETPKGKRWQPLNPPSYELTDLTDRQIWELAHAQVIKIKKSQQPYFKTLSAKLFPKVEED